MIERTHDGPKIAREIAKSRYKLKALEQAERSQYFISRPNEDDATSLHEILFCIIIFECARNFLPIFHIFMAARYLERPFRRRDQNLGAPRECIKRQFHKPLSALRGECVSE